MLVSGVRYSIVWRSNANGRHPGGVNAPIADGSIRFVTDTINQQTRSAPGTRASREVITADSD